MSINNRARDFALFMLYILIFSLPCIFTAPTVQPYNEFLKHVTSHKCYLPKEITPFSPSALGWFFLDEPLKQCDSNNSNFEVTTLCAEIFESFINATCSLDPRLSIPKVFYKLSSNVCIDLASSDGIIPKIENYFGGRLSDNTVCLAVCGDEYKILCKVLLWSYQVHHHIETAINATKSQNEMEPIVNRVPENQYGLASNIIPKDEVEDPTQSQNERNPIGNPNVVSSTPITVEASDNTLPKSNLQSEIAKTMFESQKRLIPDFRAKDDDQGQSNKETQAKAPVEMISSTNTNNSTAGPSKTSSNVQVEVTKTTNQLENVRSTQDSPKNETAEHTIEETSEKKLITSNAKNTAAKNTKQDLKSKLKEKYFQKTVGEINMSSPNPGGETNVGNDNAAQTATKEKLSNAENHQPDLKDKSVQNNEMVSNKEDPADEPIHKTPEAKQVGANVEEVKLNSGKDVLSLDTVHNTENNARLNLSGTSTVSVTNAGKSLGQEHGQQLSESQDNLSSTKMEIKSTVEMQGKDTDGVASESTDLEATTLEATLEEMDDANELPPPVQEQDQYNLENGDTEREYDKPDYDGALSPSTEVKKILAQDSFITSEKTAVFNDPQSEMSKLYDNLMPKSFGGQMSEDIRRIPPFPEEEDGHFFFYFLSVILILMIGYLVFHNKQKIIALIVEGRHERRRRSYGAGYKKLETK